MVGSVVDPALKQGNEPDWVKATRLFGRRELLLLLAYVVHDDPLGSENFLRHLLVDDDFFFLFRISGDDAASVSEDGWLVMISHFSLSWLWVVVIPVLEERWLLILLKSFLIAMCMLMDVRDCRKGNEKSERERERERDTQNVSD